MHTFSKLLVSAASAASLTAAEKPNVLFFLADDHQATLLSALGNESIKTPHLDKLLNRGTYFSNAHAEFPTSAPSRASIISGCSGLTHGAIFPRWSGYFKPELVADTWTQTMKKGGYETAWMGKWNTHGPIEKFGVDHPSCIKVGGMGPHWLKAKGFDGKTYEGFSSTVFCDAAIRYLDSYKAEKPFFMTVAFTAPHDPRTPPKEFEEMYKNVDVPFPKNFMPNHPFDDGYTNIRDERLLPRPRKKDAVTNEIRKYYGLITQMDEQIGRTIKALEDKKLLDNTIIIFCGDHGLGLGHHGLLGKFNMYTHSTQTPLIFAGPGIPKSKKDSLVYLHDIYPTICEMAGLEIPKSVEGKSLAPIIVGKEEKVRDYIFCANSNLQRMVRNSRYKLIRFYRDEKEKKGTNKYVLFDLKTDPNEMKDLINSPEYADIVKMLKKELRDWQKAHNDIVEY